MKSTIFICTNQVKNIEYKYYYIKAHFMKTGNILSQNYN